jgi:predicted homoserine dehydrogenase-like protein
MATMVKQALEARASRGEPIQVGFVGAGRMGTGAICQIGLMRGMRTAVIADIDMERVVRAFELTGYDRADVVITNSQIDASAALRHDKPVATEDSQMMLDLGIDAVVESTGNPEVGARVALQAIQARKHAIAERRDRCGDWPDTASHGRERGGRIYGFFR